jgi:hypothetical protein
LAAAPDPEAKATQTDDNTTINKKMIIIVNLAAQAFNLGKKNKSWAVMGASENSVASNRKRSAKLARKVREKVSFTSSKSNKTNKIVSAKKFLRSRT